MHAARAARYVLLFQKIIRSLFSNECHHCCCCRPCSSSLLWAEEPSQATLLMWGSCTSVFRASNQCFISLHHPLASNHHIYHPCKGAFHAVSSIIYSCFFVMYYPTALGRVPIMPKMSTPEDRLDRFFSQRASDDLD